MNIEAQNIEEEAELDYLQKQQKKTNRYFAIFLFIALVNLGLAILFGSLNWSRLYTITLIITIISSVILSLLIIFPQVQRRADVRQKMFEITFRTDRL